MSRELKSILKPDDVISYQPLILPVLKQNFMNYCIITSNKGTGGPILLDVLSKMNNTKKYLEDLSLLNSFKSMQFVSLKFTKRMLPMLLLSQSYKYDM